LLFRFSDGGQMSGSPKTIATISRDRPSACGIRGAGSEKPHGRRRSASAIAFILDRAYGQRSAAATSRPTPVVGTGGT
jgi:hypothetical protein